MSGTSEHWWSASEKFTISDEIDWNRVEKVDFEKWIKSTVHISPTPVSSTEESIKEVDSLLFWFKHNGHEEDQWAADALEKIRDRLQMEGL